MSGGSSGTRDSIKTNCYHCGDVCQNEVVSFDDKSFCCDGCKMVFELLKENNLCTYYNLDAQAGVSPKLKNFEGRFAYLDDPEVISSLIKFRDNDDVIIVFNLPQIHCSSCVWLLEHLYKLNNGILSSRTDFLRKEITIQFKSKITSVRSIVELLATLGYEPLLNLDSLNTKTASHHQKKRIYRIVIAGFCFGNIMLMSFPEYFHITSAGDTQLQRTFTFLNLFLSLPVLLFSGGEFFQSALKSLKAGFLNIDVPLVLSIIITFGRSLYEILSGTGAGYLDSMSGIIFFMLIGRFFQEKTHYNLQFDRNYKSFFPISILLKRDSGNTESVPLPILKIGDIMVIHSQELIPADSKLLSNEALIDYSFVTGESEPVRIIKGSVIYAGGKQMGSAIECEVLKAVSQSYLTGLWNKEIFSGKEKIHSTFIDGVARNFTIFLLLLSGTAFLFWLPTDIHRGLNALTTVLIVACPCALLLSSTFTNGAIMRIFSRNKCYLKNPGVLESLSKISHVVFDKTGTITNNIRRVKFHGRELGEHELTLIFSLVRHSNHPLSKALSAHLNFCDSLQVDGYKETAGLGIHGFVSGVEMKVGNASYCGASDNQDDEIQGTKVFVSFGDVCFGYFSFERSFRKGAARVIKNLRESRKISFLSGDNDAERTALSELAGEQVPMFFSQSPHQKMEYVHHLQSLGGRVAMIGDGLNDAGALRQSNVGIAVSDDVNNFSPACDAIIEGSAFSKIDKLFELAKGAQRIIKASFILSIFYNVVGLSFAVKGELLPVIAAILMPLSSISIILFTNGLCYVKGRRIGLE